MENWWIVWQMSKIKQREILREANHFRVFQRAHKTLDTSGRQPYKPKARPEHLPLLASFFRYLGQRLIAWATVLKGRYILLILVFIAGATFIAYSSLPDLLILPLAAALILFGYLFRHYVWPFRLNCTRCGQRLASKPEPSHDERPSVESRAAMGVMKNALNVFMNRTAAVSGPDSRGSSARSHRGDSGDRRRGCNRPSRHRAPGSPGSTGSPQDRRSASSCPPRP